MITIHDNKQQATTPLIDYRAYYIPKRSHMIVALYLAFITSVSAQITNLGDMMLLSDTQIGMVASFENKSTGTFINDGEVFIYNDVTNDGVLDYQDEDSKIHLQGNSNQTLTNNAPSYVSNLVVNNTSGLASAVALRGMLSVDTQVDFTAGILQTLDESSTLFLPQESSVVNMSDDSFVDGFVTKEGTEEFVFPIGDDAFYRYLSISSPSHSNASYSAKYSYNDVNTPYASDFRIGNLMEVNSNEYWFIKNGSTIDEELEISLSWENNPLVSQESIRMARWDFEQNAWTEVQDTSVDVANHTISATQTIGEMAVFTIARASIENILPEGVFIWNGVSPNNDNKNDYFEIDNIQNLPNNSVTIYNRWGTKIFETSDYDTSGNVFRGYADTNDSRLLPSGTYFYVITYDYSENGSTKQHNASGYLYLTTD